MTLTDRERAEQYLSRTPDATTAELAGALGIEPERASQLAGEIVASGDGRRVLKNADFTGGNYPHLNAGFASWVCWLLIEGRKQPFAPYSDLPRYTDDDSPHKFSWSHPENLTDFETAREWARKHPDMKGVGFILQHQSDPYKEPADPTVLIDLDDVINADGEIHPYAAELVFDRAGTYGDVSVSHTGMHLIGVGELPDGVRTIQDELPAVEGFPDAEIEVYDGKRFCAMSGKWLDDTPRDVNDISGVLSELVDEFATTNKTSGGGSVGVNVDVDNSAFDDVDITDDMDVIFDAIESVGPRDIRLNSTKERERPDGEIDYDPSYRQSKSGTGLAWFDDDGKWCDRDGMHYFDSLKLVALEERIITSMSDYPEGEDYWKAVEELRSRGASIPRFAGNDRDRLGLHQDATDDDEKAEQFVKEIELM